MKNLIEKNVTCYAICDTSDFLQKLDISFAEINWYDDNIDDVHMFPSCYETKNNDLGDISKGKTHIEDDDSGDRWTR